MKSVGEARHAAVEAEIRGEIASALGDSARRMERALAALREEPTAEQLLDEAADAVWGFFIQRELMGLRDREQVISDYAIPRAVLNRTGMMKAKG